MTKPPECASCPFVKSSTGFCADAVPPKPKIAIVTRMPSKTAVATGELMGGREGYFWWKDFMWPEGLQKEDVLLASVLRCYPNAGSYPTGKLRVLATNTCAVTWDGGIRAFDPNIFGVSIAPTMLFSTPNQAKFLHRAIRRAKEYADAGYRPLLLLGEEAKTKFAPWLQGGMKQWQGHWYEGSLNGDRKAA